MSERGFGFPRHVTGMRVYGLSKLANILFTFELARRLEGTRVTTNAVPPRGVATRLGTNNPGLLGKLLPLAMRPFFKTPAQGAETSLYVATAPELANTNGRYFADSKNISRPVRRRDAGARVGCGTRAANGSEAPWRTRGGARDPLGDGDAGPARAGRGALFARTLRSGPQPVVLPVHDPHAQRGASAPAS
jgi:NAD(P)-dependent dehydrogenase (short-subunit alcohol dehydrogenase family)